MVDDEIQGGLTNTKDILKKSWKLTTVEACWCYSLLDIRDFSSSPAKTGITDTS